MSNDLFTRKNLKNIKLGLARWKIDFLIFLSLLLLVGYLQYLLLGLLFNYGFTPDDWRLLSFYKTLGDDPFSKISYVWSVKGAYTTSQVYFIGILNNLFGFNYSAYHVTNIILKILATASIYPLVLVIFRRRLLAFLTSILYGMSYMGSRSLEYVVKGTDYLAIIPMSIFFIIYYLIVKGRLGGWWFVLMAFFWFLSLIISPIRIYPILALVLIIELFLWIQSKTVRDPLGSFKRLAILYIPFSLIYLYNPGAVLNFLQSPPILFQAITRGNLHIVLTPFQGLGLSLFSTTAWNQIFGNIDISSIGNYVSFLLSFPKGPLFIASVISCFLSMILFKKKWHFFFVIFFSNFLLDLIFYVLAIYGLNMPEGLRFRFDLSRMYPVLVSGFMLSVSVASFLAWRTPGKKKNLLLALWIMPLIILIYIFQIWLLAPFGVGFENRQGYYLTIPTIGASIFLSAFLVAIYDKAKEQKKLFMRIILLLIFFLILLNLFSLSKKNINYYFSNGREDGRYVEDQEKLYDHFLKQIGNLNFNENNMFYFDVSGNALHSSYYYEQGLLENLPSRILLTNNGKSINGCFTAFYQGIGNLHKLIVTNSDVKGFVYTGQCNENTRKVIYPLDSFYAFKILDGKFINIKQDVLKFFKFD